LAIAAMRRFFDLIAGALLEILFESGLEHVDDRVTCDERVIVLRRGLGVRSAALGALGLRLARSCALSQVQPIRDVSTASVSARDMDLTETAVRE
jgi:hypothetical protein